MECGANFQAVEEDAKTTTTTEKIWPGDEEKHELFSCLKANSLKTDEKKH